MPNITGYNDVGGFSAKKNTPAGALYTSIAQANTNLTFYENSESNLEATLIDASRSNAIYGSSDTVMPASVETPIALYLGRPTEI